MSEIGYACVVARKFTNDLSVSFQCNFPVGATPEAINAELDKLAQVLDRQQTVIDIPTLERQIKQEKANLETQGKSIADLTAKIEAGPNKELRVQNITQMKTQRDNALTTYEAMRENIKRAEAHLEALKQAA